MVGKTIGWNVDHSLDDPPPSEERKGSVSTSSDKSSVVLPDFSDELETPEMKKARKRSLWVAYVTMFVMSIGFSIVLSGVWPYLKNINGSMTKEALGWVVAANPFGQMVASPLLGIWGNKAGSIRPACLATIACFIFGNALYSCLYGIKDPSTAYYVMIFARFIVGVSSANVTLCRSYVAGATTQKERTLGISIIAAAQALGFVVGPVIQAILTVTVEGTTGSGALTWDKYTSAGWVAAVLGFINLVIMLPCVFQEHYIAAKEYKAMKERMPQSTEEVRLPKLKVQGIICSCIAFGLVVYNTSVRETLATPLIMDQYALPQDTAAFFVSIFLSIAGLSSIFIFIGLTQLRKFMDERKALIFCGFLPIVVGVFAHYPLGSMEIIEYNCTQTVTTIPSAASTAVYRPLGLVNRFEFPSVTQNYEELNRAYEINEEENDVVCVGCDYNLQPWCEITPAIPPWQLITSFLITILGYPVALSMTQSVFSKMLGPRPQGLWMGLLTGCGSLARVTGPLWISTLYQNCGTVYLYMVLGALETLAMVLLLVSYDQLEPMKIAPKTASSTTTVEQEL